MDLPDISMWNAGTEHDEDTFNAIADALKFLLDPPQAEINQTTTQSIATGTTTATPVTFQSATMDNDDMWDVTTPTILTVQTPGWYEAEWAVSWAAKTDETLRSSSLYLNGSYGIGAAVCYSEFINASGTNKPQIWQSYDLFLNAGDTVAVGLLQSTGAALSTASSASDPLFQTFLRLRWASL